MQLCVWAWINCVTTNDYQSKHHSRCIECENRCLSTWTTFMQRRFCSNRPRDMSSPLGHDPFPKHSFYVVHSLLSYLIPFPSAACDPAACVSNTAKPKLKRFRPHCQRRWSSRMGRGVGVLRGFARRRGGYWRRSAVVRPCPEAMRELRYMLGG